MMGFNGDVLENGRVVANGYWWVTIEPGRFICVVCMIRGNDTGSVEGVKLVVTQQGTDGNWKYNVKVGLENRLLLN